MELDNRKKEILKSIINEYVTSAEPVSSGNIIKKYPINLSSATIRNEMVELEKLGYIEKPYLSSGRIPSNLGYRYFVNELIKEEISEEGILDLEDILKIRNNLKKNVNNLEELSKITSATLSEITHYTSIVVGPKNFEDVIESIQIVSLKDNLIMVLIVTQEGLIKESIIRFEETLTKEFIDSLNNIFTKKLVGKKISEINSSIENFIKEEMEIGINIIKKIIEEINKVIFENFVHIDGQINSLKLPELQNEEYRDEYIRIIENNETLKIFEENCGEDGIISIQIAGEEGGLQNFSVITLDPKIENKNIGKISVVAPKRMNYKKVIATMKELLKVLIDERGGESKNGK